MTEVKVDIDVLRGLIQKLLDLEIDARCHRFAVNRALVENQPLRSHIVALNKQHRAAAGDEVYLRYRELLDALENGKDFHFALSKLVRPAGNQ